MTKRKTETPDPHARSLPGERWRPVRGFRGYEVSNLGRVRSFRSGRQHDGSLRKYPVLRKLVPRKNGYLTIQLMLGQRRVLRFVHALVLTAFRGLPRRGQETRHKNNLPSDNRLRNLAWGTRYEQFADQRRAGTDTRGERNAGARFTNAQVRSVRTRLRKGERGSDLAREFRVADATISRIKHRVRYASA